MKKILITIDSWERRVAITRDDLLENIYFGASTDRVLERAYFRGKIIKLFPGIQTAFVDIGQEKAGFLHISEIDRDLAMNKIEGVDQIDIIKDQEDTDHSVNSMSKVNIADIFKENEEILVQVSKEPIGEKGAKLTTCFTLPGRFIVLMPNIGRVGISKKIESREERQRLKEIVLQALPSGMGGIIRTSAQDCTQAELEKDIQFLLNDWNSLLKKYEKAEPKTKIHEDVDISLQVVRDHLDDDVEAIITDDKKNQEAIYNYLKVVAPEFKFKVRLYDEPGGLFERFKIDDQIQKALHKKADLKSGGSIIIESTEAMTVIDVNTGRFTGKNDIEETILKTNLEAARETVRQLRLRNIGGLIVIDFIDMSNVKNRQKLVEFFEEALKRYDRFQSVVLEVSEFGLVQMTRKRSGKRLTLQLLDPCLCCKGTGQVVSVRTESYEILRKAEKELALLDPAKKVYFRVHPNVFDFISSIEYNAVLALEAKYNCHIVFISDATFERHQYRVEQGA